MIEDPSHFHCSPVRLQLSKDTFHQRIIVLPPHMMSTVFDAKRRSQQHEKDASTHAGMTQYDTQSVLWEDQAHAMLSSYVPSHIDHQVRRVFFA